MFICDFVKNFSQNFFGKKSKDSKNLCHKLRVQHVKSNVITIFQLKLTGSFYPCVHILFELCT